jgi:hypothetical protein
MAHGLFCRFHGDYPALLALSGLTLAMVAAARCACGACHNDMRNDETAVKRHVPCHGTDRVQSCLVDHLNW